MTEITINTEWILIGIGFFVVAIVAVAAGIYIFAPVLHPGTATTIATPVSSATVSPTPVSTNQVTNAVTINYMTTSGGFPQVGISEDNRVFKVDYTTYDYLELGEVVQFTTTGTEQIYSSTIYDVSAVNILSYGYDYDHEDGFKIIYGQSVVHSDNGYPVYYYDPSTHKAWQWDGKRADQISVKELRGESHVVRGRPPNR